MRNILVICSSIIQMPKKKRLLNTMTGRDFTINDCANAPKPVNRIKKNSVVETVAEPTWDQLDDDELDIVEEANEDGTKTIVYRKKRNRSKSEPDDIQDRPGLVYPEIVWYLVSKYIKPEDVGRFAGINKTTYSMTKRESFWRRLYHTYCENHSTLPERLKLENSYTLYGLRQRVIRALYHTYHVFMKNVRTLLVQDSNPHLLVRRRCVNLWYSKGPGFWIVYFKFKKVYPLQKSEDSISIDFIEELGRIDANPDEDTQVLQVTCQMFNEVPPLMGFTLSSVSVVMSQGFQYHRLHLGFNAGPHVSKDVLPEHSVVLDKVVYLVVHDWWHPLYPHFDNRLPSNVRDEESVPVLKKSFFNSCDTDL